jgi:cyanate lyase
VVPLRRTEGFRPCGRRLRRHRSPTPPACRWPSPPPPFSASTPCPEKSATAVAELLGLGDDAALLLQTIPVRGSMPNRIPTDPTMYRFYEMLQVYGTTLKALVHEQFGDGIISAINFKLDVKKVADPDGGERAVITLDGKYLPTKPF